MTAPLRHRLADLIKERYEVLGELGSGAFGTVYRCRDNELGTEVAVKELHVLNAPGAADDATGERAAALLQFRREAVNLSQLRHPHIVSGHYERDAGSWFACPVCGEVFAGAPRCPTHNAALAIVRERHYLVMEYLDGPDLGQAAGAAGGVLKIDAALRYIRQTAEALELIHSRGFVHRDVKPENIHIRLSGDAAVLLDFGIATAAGAAGDFSTRAQRHTTGGGTLGYAPDSAAERRYPDARSDIHALGMTLYRLVSGRDPTDPHDLGEMRLSQPSKFNTGLNGPIDALILDSIDSNPDARPQSAEEFLERLDAATAPPRVVSAAPFSSPPLSDAGVGGGRPSAAPTVAHGAVPEFVFRSGERAVDVIGLMHLIDRHRQEAKEYLYHGDFATWFARLGRFDLAQRARDIVLEYPDRKYQGLEALAQATGLVAPPSLEIEPRRLDAGVLPLDGRRRLSLALVNRSRGHLFGTLRCPTPGVYFDEAFEGNHNELAVNFDGRSLGPGAHRGEITIDSSAGEIRVPFTVQVQRAASLAPTITVLFWSILGMAAGLLLRLLPTTTLSPTGGRWLEAGGDAVQQVHYLVFGAALFGALMVLVVGEATRRRNWSFFVSAVTASFSFSLLCTWVAADLLVAGDTTLRPLLAPFVRDWAAGGWMTAGGFAGAAYGTLRRLADVFSARIAQVLLGWLAFALVAAILVFIARLGGIG